MPKTCLRLKTVQENIVRHDSKQEKERNMSEELRENVEATEEVDKIENISFFEFKEI